jgi:hypothetical protein
LRKYTIIFAVAYLLSTVGSAFISEALKLKAGVSLNLAVVFAAGFIAAWSFGKDRQRAPSKAENASFAWQALSSVWIISFILVATFLAFLSSPAESKAIVAYATSKEFLPIGAGAAVVISAVYYIAIRWSFSWFAKRHFRQSQMSTKPSS